MPPRPPTHEDDGRGRTKRKKRRPRHQRTLPFDYVEYIGMEHWNMGTYKKQNERSNPVKMDP